MKPNFYVSIILLLIGMVILSCGPSPNLPAAVDTPQVSTPTGLLFPAPLPTSYPPTNTPKPLPTFTLTILTSTRTVATSSSIKGWWVYHNEAYNYEFSYPPETTLKISSADGFPPEELPAGMTFEEYLHQLQDKLGELCVIATYGQSFLLIQAPNSWDYILCGGFGIGDEPIVELSTQVSVNNKIYKAHGWKLYKQEGAKKTPYSEFFFVDLEDGTHIAYGAASTDPTQFADYLEVKGILLHMLASYRTIK